MGRVAACSYTGRVAMTFIVFWVLLFLARDDLGIQGIAVAAVVWLVLIVGFVTAGISPLYFVAVQSLIGIVLILKVFGEDITIG